MRVYATHSYSPLQARLCQLTGWPAGQVERKTFPDDEHYHRILDEAAHRHAVLLGGTISDADTLELYDLASGLVDAEAATLTIVIPYLGYSTMERAVKPGEVVKAKNRARLFSSIPHASRGNRVILIDLHSEGLPYYFEGVMRPVHLYAKPVVLEAAHRLGGEDFVLASTDAGRAKWVQSLAHDLGVPASFAFKQRLPSGESVVTAVEAHVEGRRVVIYDDMIRTGRSLLNAAAAYRRAGARSLAAVATHGVFPGDALDRLRASGLFERIICTDTHPRAEELATRADGFLEVMSVAPLLAQFLQRRL